jgi:hypothetical protein
MILPSIGLSSFGLGSFPEESNVLQLRKTSRDAANKKRANVFAISANHYINSLFLSFHISRVNKMSLNNLFALSINRA